MKTRRFTPFLVPALGALLLLAATSSPLFSQAAQGPGGHGADPPDEYDPNWPGIREPVLSELFEKDFRMDQTIQVIGFNEQVNIIGKIVRTKAQGRKSLGTSTIANVNSPFDDLTEALDDLQDAAEEGDAAAMLAPAQEVENVLLGNTQGYIYDGFPLLNFNMGAVFSDQVPGEYKMKQVVDSGETIVGPHGAVHKIWDVTVNMLWYDQNFDSDTYLIRVPLAANEFDFLRVHYRIYSLSQEILSPTSILEDYAFPGSLGLPFKAFDMLWRDVNPGQVTDATVQFPQFAFLKEIATWGYNKPQARRQRIHLVFEQVNAHTGQVGLDPAGRSLAERNRALTLDGIGDAAPEKKLYNLAQAVLAGASPLQVVAMMGDDEDGTPSLWEDWVALAQDPGQLPPEAWAVLAQEGIPQGTFGPYRFVSVFLNNEMYGDGPFGQNIPYFFQGYRFAFKVINLDNHTHYLRVEDGGPRLYNSIRTCYSAPQGQNSLEIQNRKPIFGAPKEMELQWRAAWGFRPHLDVISQSDLFRRPKDRLRLLPFQDGEGTVWNGWQYDPDLRGGDFVFNPPQTVIGTPLQPSSQGLRESDGTEGLLIGTTTPGYGTAKMCTDAAHALGDYCRDDLSGIHPLGLRNVDLDGDGVNDVLWFPPYLRNPDPNGGDLILGTPEWKPFLWLNPANGSLLVDPADPSQGWWADKTFVYGAPVPGGGSMTATIQAPRAFGRALYLVDGLFSDNAVYSIARPVTQY